MELVKLQSLFLQTMSSNASPFEQLIKSDHLSAQKRVQIYIDSIEAGKARALSEIFPVCEKYVGETFFYRLASAYQKQHASYSPDLAEYGEHFPQFMSQFEPLQNLPYLPCLARLEWAWHRVLLGPDSLPFDFEKLSTLMEAGQLESLCCRLQANTVLLASDYPMLDLWQFGHDEGKAVDLNSGGCQLVIWRSGLEMRMDPLSEQEFTVLTAIQNGMKLAQISHLVSEAALSALLGKWCQNALICEIA